MPRIAEVSVSWLAARMCRPVLLRRSQMTSAAVLVPYAALIVVLLWRPTGLAGKRVA